MGFKEYVPQETLDREATITILPTGVMSINAAAVEEYCLEDFTRVVLLYDEERKVIGLSPSYDALGTLRLSLAGNGSGMVVPAKEFLDQFAFSVKEEERYRVRYNEKEEVLELV